MRYITTIYQTLKDDHVELINSRHTISIDNMKLCFNSAGWLATVKINEDVVKCSNISYKDKKIRFKLENGLFYNKVVDKNYNNIVE